MDKKMSFCIEVESENYGKYISECIGIVDFDVLVKNLSVDDYFKWSSKYHPSHFFKSCSLIPLSKANDKAVNNDLVRFALFVPSDELNKNWDSSIWTTKNNLGKKKRALPIGFSNKIISKWQNVNPSIFTPEYFINATCIEDLQINLPFSNDKIVLEREIFISENNPIKS